MVEQAPDVPWLELHELVDLDDSSGEPVVTVRLCFNANAGGAVPTPSMSEVTLYAQHQCEVQRLVAAHGMAAVPWPPTAYTGSTAFDLLFPERLALNRDLLFVLYATPRALRRYTRVLQQTTRACISAAHNRPAAICVYPGAVARWAVVTPWCTSAYTRKCQPPPPQGANSSTPGFRKKCSQHRCSSGSNVSRPLPMPMRIFSNWLRHYALCSTRRQQSRCGCSRRPSPLHLRRGVACGLPEHHEAHDGPASQQSDGAPPRGKYQLSLCLHDGCGLC